MNRSSTHYRRTKNSRMASARCGFTLIELLVVISIIALLLSVLLPALKSAKDQARVTICRANSKQIGTAVAGYSADNKGQVPMLTNYSGTQTISHIPAKHSLMSVALRSYVGERPLPEKFSPDKPWPGWGYTNTTFSEYCRQAMPKFFACPFVRESKNDRIGFEPEGTVSFGSTTKNKARSIGYIESYWTHASGIYAQASEHYRYSPKHPLGTPHGTPKFAMLPWNNGYSIFPTLPNWFAAKRTFADGAKSAVRHETMVKHFGAGSLSNAAIFQCAMGEWDNYSDSPGQFQIVNYGSHKKGKTGGTNIGMADGHVEWVEGTRVGWM